MRTKLLLLITVACALVNAPAWAQVERKLVIEPGLPSSHDLITISVSNSRCFANSVVLQATEPNTIQIRLTFLLQYEEQCLRDNPNAPNFATIVGPLAPGEYGVTLFLNFGGVGSNFTDELNFTVIQPPPPVGLSEGGINGLYHDPQAPHRYLYVLETDYTTLVVWNTFDPEGNQLWVYGVGDRLNDGQSVVADTYINTSGGFLPNGEADDDVDRWGVIRVDMSSCTEARVTYQSDLPEFGSGEFSVVRLAYSKQIGCVDSE